MKNVIDAGTNIPVTVNPNGTIPMTTIVRRFNRSKAISEVDVNANSIVINTKACCQPRYNIWATITFTAPVAGDVTFTIYQDGMAIPLALATATITTVDTQTVTIPLKTTIKAKGCSTTAITLVNTGAVAADIVNANILVIED